MEKIITISYQEHEEMKSLIESQAKAMIAVMKKGNVVVIRDTQYSFGWMVPHIEYEGKDTVIKELQGKYNILANGLAELRLAFEAEGRKRRKEKKEVGQGWTWW